jgi:hypothetical protein
MKKRRYRLSEKGLQSLRAAIARNQPWRRATGPKSEWGKRVSSMNGFKSDLYLDLTVLSPRSLRHGVQSPLTPRALFNLIRRK